jgi:uncharacterized membrane protein (UPF0127 family)
LPGKGLILISVDNMKLLFNLSRRFISGRPTRVLRSSLFAAGICLGAISLGFLPSLILDHPGQAQRFQSFVSAPLTLVTGSGRHNLTVEIAENDAQRSQGLMFRRILASDRGMLFIYPSDRIISMWMKNTFIPLDMVFIGNGGRVVSAHERAVPGSLQAISSGSCARAVLELAGGSVSRLGIRAGDQVMNARLGAGR